MMFLQWVGLILGALMALIVLYLAVVIFVPVLSVPKQPLEISKKDVEDEPPRSRRDISFQVDGTQVSAWLYLPEDTSPPVPCIVMNHGLGGTKDSALEAYALRFQQAGMAVLTYDYRYSATPTCQQLGFTHSRPSGRLVSISSTAATAPR